MGIEGSWHPPQTRPNNRYLCRRSPSDHQPRNPDHQCRPPQGLQSPLDPVPPKVRPAQEVDSSAEDVKMAEDESKIVKKVTAAIPIDSGVGLKHAFQEIKKGDVPKGEENAFRKLRIARSDARLAGVREKREKAKAEAEDAKNIDESRVGGALKQKSAKDS